MLGQDKIEHWAFGFVLTWFGIINPWLTFTALAFAIGKELYDWKFKAHFDILDVYATIIGFVMAIVLLEVIL